MRRLEIVQELWHAWDTGIHDEEDRAVAPA